MFLLRLNNTRSIFNVSIPVDIDLIWDDVPAPMHLFILLPLPFTVIHQSLSCACPSRVHQTLLSASSTPSNYHGCRFNKERILSTCICVCTCVFVSICLSGCLAICLCV